MTRYRHDVDLSGIGAIAAALVAIGALWVAYLARTDSKVSAKASAVSAEAAAAAIELASIQARRETERHDVEWTDDSPDRNRVVLRNVGSTTACAVSIVLTINGNRHDLDAGDIAPGEAYEFDSAEYAAMAESDFMATVAAMRAAGVGYVGGPTFAVHARITWLSELGTPGVQLVPKQ